MAFRLNNRSCWGLAITAAAISFALAIWPVAKEVGEESNALLLVGLPAYLVLTSYLCFRLITWISDKEVRFRKVVGVLLSLLFLVGTSWLAFGGYLYALADHGLRSVNQLATEYVLRRSFHSQQLLAMLFALVEIKKGGSIDLVVAILMAGLSAALMLG